MWLNEISNDLKIEKEIIKSWHSDDKNFSIDKVGGISLQGWLLFYSYDWIFMSCLNKLFEVARAEALQCSQREIQMRIAGIV